MNDAASKSLGAPDGGGALAVGWKWLEGVVVAVFLVAAAALYTHKPPNPDQAIFDYIGWVGSSGGRYYVDVAEQNFPGEMFLHELAFRLFGVHYWAYRALDYGLLLSGAAALGGLFSLAGFGQGALVGALTYVAGYVSSNAWMSGQRDVVAANLLLIVGYLFVLRLSGKGRSLLVAVGPLLFVALLIRPTYLLFAVGLPVLDWCLVRRTGRRIGTSLVDVAVVVATMLACLAALVVWSHHAGSWPAFKEQVLMFNTQAYSAGHARWDTLSKLAGVLARHVAFVPAMILATRHALREKRGVAPMGILALLVGLALVSAIAQNKGFGYHLGAMLPAFYGLAGVCGWLFVRQLREHWRSPKHATLGAGLAVALGLLGLTYQVKSLGPQIRYLLGVRSFSEMMAKEGAGYADFSWADSFAAAAYVSSTTAPSDEILVWGRPVGIHILALRRSATRFITSGMLVLAKPPFEKSAAWQREFEDTLERRPPKIVFVPTVGGDVDYGAFVPEDNEQGVIASLRRAIAAKYDLAREFGSVRAYRLR